MTKLTSIIPTGNEQNNIVEAIQSGFCCCFPLLAFVIHVIMKHRGFAENH